MSFIQDLSEGLARATDKEAVLDAFVQAHQFPLVEDTTAVFFYWDRQPADAVTLVHWVFGLQTRLALQRLEGTDVFLLAVDLPADGRIEYKYEVQRQGRAHWVRDPLNDRRAFDPFGSNSVLPMAGYQEPNWHLPLPDPRPGTLTTLAVDSKAFGERREVQVYLPYEFRPHKRYPLLICHDGADYLRYAKLGTCLDTLIQRHEVRPLIVAFTSGRDRNQEYAANPVQASFLVDDLLPALERRFRISERSAERGLMGASFGAVSSLYTAWSHPGVFGRLMLQSGSFVFTDVGHHGRSPLWDGVVDFVNELRQDPARLDAEIFMSCGTFESLITYNRGLVPLLRRSGLTVRFVESRDGHNWIAWRDRVRDGLSWLFPGHLWMTYD